MPSFDTVTISIQHRAPDGRVLTTWCRGPVTSAAMAFLTTYLAGEDLSFGDSDTRQLVTVAHRDVVSVSFTGERRGSNR